MSSLISIILCCYNGDKFLLQALNSILNQTYIDWELIFVNDGSTDGSLQIAEALQLKEDRIKIFSKPNGGLNSARNFGVNFISHDSFALIFSDSDDILHPNMLQELNTNLQEDGVGAAYCNYELIDGNGAPVKRDNSSSRYIPTRLGVRALSAAQPVTPFYSIYTWAPMIEPMTLLKKEVFLQFAPWDDLNFGRGEYGESIPLFGEIALNYDVIYVDAVLYQYRKHGNQITSNKADKSLQEKIDLIWNTKVNKNPLYKNPVSKAMVFGKCRLPLFRFIKGDLKHELRNRPMYALRKTTEYLFKYLYSLPFFLFRR